MSFRRRGLPEESAVSCRPRRKADPSLCSVHRERDDKKHFFRSPFNFSAVSRQRASKPDRLKPVLLEFMAHILITNDDGIQAEGLRALVQAVQGLGTISVVAPSHERSAAAQSLTLRQPIFWEQVAEREWAVEGTPADSVILALNKLLPNRPDLVISGVNRGGNLGENIFYSGTVGAAMEAAINHIPAIAVSVAHKGRGFRFEHAAKFARDLAQMALAEGMPQDVVLNVNV